MKKVSIEVITHRTTMGELFGYVGLGLLTTEEIKNWLHARFKMREMLLNAALS